MNDKFTIKILTRGPIKCMGGIHGPIITPYKVDRSRLIDLLNEGLEVVQVNPGKADTKITITDITTNNNNRKFVKPEVKKEVKSEETVAETATEASVASVEPEVADTTETTTTTNYSYKKNKKH